MIQHPKPTKGQVVFAAPGSRIQDNEGNPFPVGERFRVIETFCTDQFILERPDRPEDLSYMAHHCYIGKPTDLAFNDPLESSCF